MKILSKFYVGIIYAFLYLIIYQNLEYNYLPNFVL